MSKKYKIISEDLMKCLVDFLDDAQLEALQEQSKDDLHKINFCNWAISELLTAYDCRLRLNPKTDKKNKPNRRNEIIDNHFDDWIIPKGISDDEFEKLVGQLDAFVRGWEKKYNKTQSDSKPIRRKPAPRNTIQHMDLKEIEKYLKDDPELTKEERFDLYYEEHLRIKEEAYIKNSKSLDQICKELNIKRNPGKN